MRGLHPPLCYACVHDIVLRAIWCSNMDGTLMLQLLMLVCLLCCTVQGGAVGSVQGQSWIIDRCFIADHTVQSLGGGIMVAGSPTMMIRDTIIVNNRLVGWMVGHGT